jgi:MFS family permease
MKRNVHFLQYSSIYSPYNDIEKEELRVNEVDFQQSLESINYLAVVTAALSAFIIGGLWYSVLFGKAWMKENRFDEEALRKGNMGLIFGCSFILSFIISFVLVLFLGPERNAMIGALAGFMAGIFWVAASMGITYLFERKSVKLFFINAGYHVITFTLMGIILGIWK